MDHNTVYYYSQNAQQVADRYEAVVSSLSEHFFISYKPNSRVLDIGCGSGRDLAVLHKLGHQCYGIDPTPEFVEIAQRVHPELSDRIVQGALPELMPPFGGEFDGVLCSAERANFLSTTYQRVQLNPSFAWESVEVSDPLF